MNWAVPAAITAGTTLGPMQLDAVASVPGMLNYSPSYGTFLSVGNDQVLSVTFVPTDSTDYEQVTTTTTINVRPNLTTTAIIEFAGDSFPANVTDGTVQIVLARAGNLASPVSVVLSSVGGRVVAAFRQTINIAANATSATVSIPIANDGRADEGDAAILLSLSAPAPGLSWAQTHLPP